MKRTYESEKVVKFYTTLEHLQKPEQTIFKILEDRLPYWKMLDVGVGGGRTTRHFAPLVAEYVGVDYAANMVKVCEEIFTPREDHISFQVADARYLDQFDDDYFDYILFSYNGIDNISHEDRLLALKEIRRTGKKGGFFAFSTHNLRNFHTAYRIRLYANLKKTAYQILSFFLLLILNGLPGKHQRKPFAIVNDGIHRFGLKMYYIKPEEQVKQLEKAGFENVRLFSVATGKEISLEEAKLSIDETWIYYLCEIR